MSNTRRLRRLARHLSCERLEEMTADGRHPELERVLFAELKRRFNEDAAMLEEEQYAQSREGRTTWPE